MPAAIAEKSVTDKPVNTTEAPEAGEPNAQQELQTTDVPVKLVPAVDDPFADVPWAAKEDPAELLRRQEIEQAVRDDRNTFDRRLTVADLAVQYLNCQYAGSNPQRVNVIAAAEAALLHFFATELPPGVLKTPSP